MWARRVASVEQVDGGFHTRAAEAALLTIKTPVNRLVNTCNIAWPATLIADVR